MPDGGARLERRRRRSSSCTPRTDGGWSGSPCCCVRDQGVAEEVVQDSFVAMHASWGRLRDPDKAPGLPAPERGQPLAVAPAAPRRRPTARRARRRPADPRRAPTTRRTTWRSGAAVLDALRRAARPGSARCSRCATTSTCPRREIADDCSGSAGARSRATPRGAPPRSGPTSPPTTARRPDERRRSCAGCSPTPSPTSSPDDRLDRDPCLRAPRPPGGTHVPTAFLALRRRRSGRHRRRDRRSRLGHGRLPGGNQAEDGTPVGPGPSGQHSATPTTPVSSPTDRHVEHADHPGWHEGVRRLLRRPEPDRQAGAVPRVPQWRRRRRPRPRLALAGLADAPLDPDYHTDWPRRVAGVGQLGRQLHRCRARCQRPAVRPASMSVREATDGRSSRSIYTVQAAVQQPRRGACSSQGRQARGPGLRRPTTRSRSSRASVLTTLSLVNISSPTRAPRCRAS